MTALDARAISIASKAILMVDDEPLIRQMARHFLERVGFRVLEAGGAAEALKLYQANAARIQLLLTDLNMPGMTGIELASRIRRQRPDMPIVFMSGSLREFNAFEMRDWLSVDKPFQAAELVRCVQKALASARQEPAQVNPKTSVSWFVTSNSKRRARLSNIVKIPKCL